MEYLKQFPDKNGYFGQFGGSFVPEVLQKEMDKITKAYYSISKSHDFIMELRSIRKHFQGRPTPVYYCKRLSEKCGGRIYLKREDLNHTGAHKLNHCMGEALLAKYMGKKKVIAETGAGQHGVALATAAAYFGLECEIHMGEVYAVLEMKVSAWSLYRAWFEVYPTTTTYTFAYKNSGEVLGTVVAKAKTGTAAQYEEMAHPSHAHQYQHGHGHGHGTDNAGGGIITID